MAKKNNTNDNFANLKAIADLMEQKNLSVVKMTTDDATIEVERGARMLPMTNMTNMAAAASPAAAPQASNIPMASDDPVGAVKSPVVGTVYLSAKPGEANFIKVGDKVKQGAVLMIVEAMKVMNQIVAPKDGTVNSIMVSNEDPVEFGQPLVVIL